MCSLPLAPVTKQHLERIYAQGDAGYQLRLDEVVGGMVCGNEPLRVSMETAERWCQTAVLAGNPVR